MAPRAGRRVRNFVANVEHVANRLLGKEIIGAVRNRAVRAISGGIPSYKKGGRVKRTGKALVHKGELIIPAKHAKALHSLLMKK